MLYGAHAARGLLSPKMSLIKKEEVEVLGAEGASSPAAGPLAAAAAAAAGAKAANFLRRAALRGGWVSRGR